MYKYIIQGDKILGSWVFFLVKKNQSITTVNKL